MTVRRRLVGLPVALATVGAVGLAAAPAAQAQTPPTGERSLASVLTSGGVGFDHDPFDYDIVTAAVLAVLQAKPASPVSVLTDGSVALTAFLPDDLAFERLSRTLTGHWPGSEQAAFTSVAGLGIDTVEAVLLYHVVPGATLTARQALASDGAVLTTAQGGTLTVDVRRCWWWKRIVLQDQDPRLPDPTVVQYDINKGNLQIAHGISRVLLPVAL